jgi:hypothetical protein
VTRPIIGPSRSWMLVYPKTVGWCFFMW